MTAVEWLCNEWLYLDQQFDMCLIDRNIYWDKLRQIQEQAKEMEKEQMFDYIKKNYINGEHSLKFHKEEFEQYYNETYGK